MHEADFSEALGRLLTDGALRDRFAADPHQAVASLSGNSEVQTELLGLKIEDLEFQANVLLRKRFEVVERFFPEWTTGLGAEGWPLFQKYARRCWLQGVEDSREFLEFVRRERPEWLGLRDYHRFRFMLNPDRFSEAHLVPSGRYFFGLQILLRSRKGGAWQEWVLSL